MAELALTSALAADDVARFSAARHENDAALAWRMAAAAILAELTLPDRVQHLWKYTDPAALLPAQPLLTAAARVVLAGAGAADEPGRRCCCPASRRA